MVHTEHVRLPRSHRGRDLFFSANAQLGPLVHARAQSTSPVGCSHGKILRETPCSIGVWASNGSRVRAILDRYAAEQIRGRMDGWIVRRWSDGMEDQSSSVSIHST